MRKRLPWIVAVVALCIVGFFIYRWYSGRAALRAALQGLRGAVATAKVERRDLEVVVTGKGTVQANLKKNVQPGVAGQVGQILVEEGDLVKAGDPLLVLTNGSVTYQVDQARLDLALAEQALANMTGAAGARASLELVLKQAELNLSSARDKVDYLNVTSPISGEVWSVSVKEGDSLKAGAVISAVGDPSSFTVTARVPQADLGRIELGMAVSVAPGGDVPVLLGVVTSIGKEGVAGSKGIEFPVKIAVAGPDPNLRAGMNVNVNYMSGDSMRSLPGVVAASDRRDVKAEVDGTVSRVLASEGDSVSAGQPLVEMTNDSLVVALDRAENELEKARQDLSQFENQIRGQELKVEQARVTAEERADSAAKLVVRSPIDGKVVSLSVQAGDDVAANQVVAAVSQVSPLTVVIPVDELDIPNVAVGQPATVEIDALPGQTFEGTVRKIAQEGTVQQGITNYNVTIAIHSEVPRLGMSATANIAVAQKRGVLAIPVEAVRWEEGQAYVSQTQDGQTVQKRIRIGVQNDLYAEVAAGLEEGETVLVGGTGGGEAGFGMFGIPAQMRRTNPPANVRITPR